MAQAVNFSTNAITGGAQLTPAPVKATLSTNYVGTFDFLSHELPDLYEKEFERFGNRSIASFLRLVGAEMPSTSDLIKWSEQGRLHVFGTATKATSSTITFTAAHNVRLNQTVVINDTSNGVTIKALVTGIDVDGVTVTVAPYSAANLAALSTTASALKVFVYGSEFKKGTNGMSGSLEAKSDILETNPIIIKDKYEVNGSDMAQVGWIEVTTENGASGYLWYLKSEHETRLRFEDYLEMSMVEGEPAAVGSAVAAAGYKGTKGLFYEIANRGNVGTGAITERADLENIIKVLDKEGAIQENVLFVNRKTSFEIDTVLAAQNNFGSSGASYGLFDNEQDMALNLGFKGFNLGYDFYKTDWKYLNDATTRGSISDIDGVLVPAGTLTVYDQVLGKNAKRPFLHTRYRKSETEDRKYKSWIVGSAGGASNSELDAMQVNFLSERALVVLGANNFMLLK
ncbi:MULTISPECIES: hypothetical protein [Flavobacteriaceae]|uniref:hypothetical protein n=1 Tax=Flavobacteriaceae TaxID=49546 RepID=UPI0025E2F90C|nr:MULTISPECIES: hypothetical protein [Flavobacteriaceae]